MVRFIPTNEPVFGGEEIKVAKEVLEGGMLTHKAGLGEWTKKFESLFAEYIGSKHAIAVNSGSAALHASLLALNLTGNDEIITTPFSFVASATMGLHAGAKVIFADITPETYNIDIEKVKLVWSKKTKVIIPVHLYGHPVDMDPLIEFAEEKDVKIIEDACQAHGAEYKERKVGSIGDIGCFSFYPSKNMTTIGEGGIITTSNDEIAERLHQIRNHGESKDYETVRLGHNFRMPEISSAIGTVQLKKLPDFIKTRTKNAEFFNKVLEENPLLKAPVVKEYCTQHAWYLYTITFKDPAKRDPFIVKMQSNNIGTGIYYSTPIHLMPLFKSEYGYKGGEYPQAEQACKEVLSIPINPTLKKDELELIKDKIIEFTAENSNNKTAVSK